MTAVVASGDREEADMPAKRRAMWMLVVAALLACCASGCVYKPVQMGGPMFGSESLKGKRLVRLGEGEACSSHILYAIPVGGDSMEVALERLNKKGVWSSDVITIERGQLFWLLGWSNCTRITGYGAAAPATKFKTTTLLTDDKGPPPGVEIPTTRAEAGAP
jgi:hypothetical protein